MFSRLITYALLLAICFAQKSFADAASCSDINLINEIGPVRDQGNTGTCYAFTAAELLGHHYRREFPLGFSPIAIAFWYSVHSELASAYPFPLSAGLQGGAVDDAILQNYGEWNSEDPTQNWKPGLCRYEKLPSESPGDTPTDRFLKALDMMNGVFNRVTLRVRTDRNYLSTTAGQSDLTQIQDYLNSSRSIREQRHYNWCLNNLRSSGFTTTECATFSRLIVQIVDEGVFSAKTREHITKVMYEFGRGIRRFNNFTNQHLNSDSWGGLMNLPSSQRLMLFGEYVRLACGTYVSPQPHYSELLYNYSSYASGANNWSIKAQAYFDYFLRHGIPIGIAYDAGGLIIQSQPNVNMHHASVIIGRKVIDGECHYLVKNSFGNSWLPSKFNTSARQALDSNGTDPLWGYFYFPASKLAELVPGSHGEMRPRLFSFEAISKRRWQH